MRDITYSTKPLTLGEARLIQECQEGSVDATIKLLVARTDLTEAEVEALDVADVNEVMPMLTAAMEQASALAQLGAQL